MKSIAVVSAPSVARRLAEFAVGLAYEDSPSQETARHILDTVGVCLASVDLPYARAVASLIVTEGGHPESTAFGLNRRLPVRAAGVFNACLGHGTDFDDTHLVAIEHPTATVLPPALAVAEHLGTDCRTLITAVAVGVEVMCRIGVQSGSSLLRRGIHPTSSCGTFGVVAALARLYGLSAADCERAFGVATALTGGLHQSTIDGSWNKCIHSGLAAEAGFAAVEAVRAGFAGTAEPFEGPHGFFHAFAGLDEAAARRTLAGLSESWEANHLAYKVYPCCQGIHSYADCALDLATSERIDPSEVESIDVAVGDVVGRSLCEPNDIKRRPPTPYGAKFSIPYVVAAAIIDRAVDAGTFTPEAIARPDRLHLAARVRHHVDPAYDAGTALRGRVTVTMRDGRSLTRMTEACRGTPENPLEWAEIRSKFLSNAVPVIGDVAAAEVLDVLLDKTADRQAADIARLCGGAAAKMH